MQPLWQAPPLPAHSPGRSLCGRVSLDPSLLPVEWRLFSLRLLSETASLLVNLVAGDSEEEAAMDAERSLLSLVRNALLPQ